MTELSYGRAAQEWLDRLPLGDGRVGAMVGADVAATRIGVNEASAWSGGVGSARRDLVDPPVAAAALADARALLFGGDPVSAEEALRPLQHRYAQAFLPVGELAFRVDPAALADADPAVHRALDLDTGVHRSHAPRRRATTIVSAADDGVLVHLEEMSTDADVEVVWNSPLRARRAEWHDEGASILLDLPADVAPGHEPDESPVTWDLAGIHPHTVAVELRLRHDGTLSPTAEGAIVRGARRVVAALAIRTTFVAMGRPPGDVSVAIERARGDAARVVADEDPIGRHEAAFRSHAGGFSLDLAGGDAGSDPDERIAHTDADGCGSGILSLLIAYGVYLLRCSSRAEGPPANLQGIWNDRMQPPWSSAYTLNINTPMNYWAAEATGNSAAHLSLLNLLEALAECGADTAARLYGARGWVAHHNSDLWGYSLPTWGDASWSHWALGGAWLVRQFDEHRRHGSMTADVRERFRSVARGCARFLLDWLVDIDGAPHTVPSTSPENRFLTERGPAALTRSSAMDRALIREVLALVTELPSDDAEPDELQREARSVLARLAPARLDAEGRIAEWGEDRVDEDRQHRHLSHLYAWFPGDGTAGQEEAVARTLDTRGDDSTGWSLAWKIGLRARLRDGEGVGRLLRLVTRPATTGEVHRGGLYRNLFAAHPPFQIDGNLGLVGAFLESLVQSHRPGIIELLPALAPTLDEGRLRGFVARPGIVLDLDWQRRHPTKLRLTTKPGTAEIAIRLVHGDTEVPVRIPADGVVEVDWPSLPSPHSHHSDRSST